VTLPIWDRLDHGRAPQPGVIRLARMVVWLGLAIGGLGSSGVAAEAGGEHFDTLKIGNTIYTNVTVASATPVTVILRTEGSFQSIKRNELPPELSKLYPYDAAAAEAWEKKKAEKQTQIKEQSREAAYQGLLRKLQRVKGSLEANRQAQKELEQIIPSLEAKKSAAGNARTPAHVELMQALDRKVVFTRQQQILEQELKSLQQQVKVFSKVPSVTDSKASETNNLHKPSTEP
jgi:hypothetical protein